MNLHGDLEVDDPLDQEESLYRWNEDDLVQRACVICGKDLINQPISTEGGLRDRWGCPIHGTRGVGRH